jgi:hypothetical protein
VFVSDARNSREQMDKCLLNLKQIRVEDVFTTTWLAYRVLLSYCRTLENFNFTFAMNVWWTNISTSYGTRLRLIAEMTRLFVAS